MSASRKLLMAHQQFKTMFQTRKMTHENDCNKLLIENKNKPAWWSPKTT